MLPHRESRRDVLIVSSNRAQSFAFAQALHADGYSPVLASTGLEAYGALSQISRALVLIVVDETLQDMKGVDLRELQIDAPVVAAIPMVIVSASATSHEACSVLAGVHTVGPAAALEAIRGRLPVPVTLLAAPE